VQIYLFSLNRVELYLADGFLMSENGMKLQAADDRQVLGTNRTDLWWLSTAITVAVFSAFAIYATWRAFENSCYQYENYLSPFCSPKITVSWKAFGWADENHAATAASISFHFSSGLLSDERIFLLA
jgi:hypothetical protein